jgi:hypothetical protein
MKTSTPSIPIWAILPVVLTIETALCAVLAAAILDGFVRRPQAGGGSITTLLPGFVYASATVMKVCVVSALVSVVVGLAWRLSERGPSKRSSPGVPVWGIASIALTPSTPFLGALAVLGAQSLVAAQGVISAGHFSQVGRSAVFVMLVIILAGVLAAVTSLIRRERPSTLPILGLVANMVLVGLFWHFRFYALGFDQDMWAPR